MAEPRHDTADAPAMIAPAGRHEVDASAIGAWLAGHVGGGAKALDVRQFQGGMSNPTYLLTDPAGTRYVLRKKPPGPLLPKAHQIDREYRAMAALGPTPVPVPRMIAYCEDESVIGAEFFVMEHVAGRVVPDPGLEPVGRDERRATLFDMIDVMGALHTVDPAAVGLERHGRPDGYMARQTARWVAQAEAAKPALPAETNYADLDRLAAWVQEHIDVEEASGIAHGDFRPGNLILAPDAPRVAAVLDWELSTLGHPLADLAYFCLPYRQPAGVAGLNGLVGRDLDALGVPDESAVLARYCAATGRDGVEDWLVFLAFSFFRIAAIVQGVAARAAQGNVSTASADPAAKLASALKLAEIGVGITREHDARRVEI